MRVGVDATCWHNNRGYGRHARALLSALIDRDKANQYTLVMDSPADPETLPPGSRVQQLRANTPAALAASANGHRSMNDMLLMSRALSGSAWDVVLFPSVYSYVPVLTRARKLVIIHDVIAETYPKLTVPSATARLFWKAKVALGRMQADAIVTVSEYSKRGIIRQFGISPDRVHVVGEASDPVFRHLEIAQPAEALRDLGIPADRRVITYVGGFGPHKNLSALVTAFAAVAKKPEFADAVLVMVGEYNKEVFHSDYQSVAASVSSFGLTDRVVFTGYLPDEKLVVLLNLSSVLVLPSLMEGFGLPAVEAAACGCPVIATTESPLPELLGEAGVFINPHKDELQIALERVLSNPALQQHMKKAGLEASRKLSWQAAAGQMMDVIQKVAQ